MSNFAYTDTDDKPTSLDEALQFADSSTGLSRRKVDRALIALATEVRRLRREMESVNAAAQELDEATREQAG